MPQAAQRRYAEPRGPHAACRARAATPCGTSTRHPGCPDFRRNRMGKPILTTSASDPPRPEMKPIFNCPPSHIFALSCSLLPASKKRRRAAFPCPPRLRMRGCANQLQCRRNAARWLCDLHFHRLTPWQARWDGSRLILTMVTRPSASEARCGTLTHSLGKARPTPSSARKDGSQAWPCLMRLGNYWHRRHHAKKNCRHTSCLLDVLVQHGCPDGALGRHRMQRSTSEHWPPGQGGFRSGVFGREAS